MATTVFLSAPTKDGQLVRIAGRGTMNESQSVREVVARFLDDHQRVVIDLSQCEYMDSAFMGALIWLHKYAGEGDCSLSFFGSEQKIRELFGPCLLDRVLNTTDVAPEPQDEFSVFKLTSESQAGLAEYMEDCDRRLAALVEKEAQKAPSTKTDPQETERRAGSDPKPIIKQRSQ